MTSMIFNMILIYIQRYKVMSIKTLCSCLFLTFLFLSIFLFSLLKVHFTQKLRFEGEIINIHRDEFNIPEIHAQSHRGAMYAWGYVTAEDRLFQMTFRRLIVQGRLSEYLG